MDVIVYRLRCFDDAYYIGSHRGSDLDVRIARTTPGWSRTAWTYRRRPVELVWCEHVCSVVEAIACERQLKGWTCAKKEGLIRGDWAAIQALSRSAEPRPSTSSG